MAAKRKQLRTAVSENIAADFIERSKKVGSPSTLLSIIVTKFMTADFEEGLTINFYDCNDRLSDKQSYVSFTTTVDQDIANKFEILADKSGQSVRNLLRLLIIDFIKNQSRLTIDFDNGE